MQVQANQAAARLNIKLAVLMGINKCVHHKIKLNPDQPKSKLPAKYRT